MKKQLPIIAFIFLTCTTSSLLGQQTIFSKVYYDAGSTTGYSVIQSFDNGYMIAGSNSNKAFVMKTDSAGTLLWSKDYGSLSTGAFNKIISTNDSCFMLTGKLHNSVSGYDEIFCVKINAAGNVLWSTKIANASSEEAYSIAQTYDHGYVLTGYKNNASAPHSNIVAVKIDSAGNFKWKQTITIGNSYNIGYSIKQTPDSAYILLASVQNNSPSNYNAVIIKLASTGNLIWSKKYNRSSPVNYYPQEMEMASDGIIAFLVYNYSYTTILKIDFSGTVLWSKTCYFGGGVSNLAVPPKIRKTSDGGYVLANGTAYSGSGTQILKIDSSGNTIWNKNFMMYTIDAIESNDKGFFILGNGPLLGVKSPTYNPQIGVLKLDSIGHGYSCVSGSGGVSTSNDSLIGTNITPTLTYGGSGNTAPTAVATPAILEYTGCVSITGNIETTDAKNTFSVSPNPFTNETTITFADEQKNSTVKIIDMIGKELYSTEFPYNSKSFTLNKGQLADGIYFIQIQSDKETINKKIVIQ